MSQKSVPLQKFPSSWPAQSVSWVQPQVFVPLVHLPAAQTSPVVQLLPSSQVAVLVAWLQPVLGLQASVVHTLPSSHKTLAATTVPAHLPPPQTSFWVHAFWSLQVTALLVCTQPLAGLQESFVHGLPSSQVTPPPEQMPSPHVSF